MKKALLIGINYVSDPQARLFGCINDAVALKNMLIDAYDYSSENILVLRDDVQQTNVLPTRSNILNNIAQLMNQSSSLSEIWIHFSGHGSQIRDTNGDERDGKDEIIIPSDFRTAGIIVDDQLRALLNGAKCRVMLTMDCCNAGTNWDLPYSFPIINNQIFRRVENRNLMSNQNIFKLTGSRDDQYAGDYFCYEARVPMGVFTMALLECLRKRKHNVSLLQLYLDINKHLEKNNFTQRSLLSSSNALPFVNVVRASPSNTRTLSIEKSSNSTSRTSNASSNMRSLMTSIISKK
jgi:metacaspase-1